MITRETIMCVALGGALATGIGVATKAAGQANREPAGLRLVLDYSAGIDVDSNRELEASSDGTYSALINEFDFMILSETRNQKLSLGFGTLLRYESDPSDDTSGYDFNWTDPAFKLSYSRESANARLGVSGNYARRDVDTLEPYFTDLNGDTIIDESGYDNSTGELTSTGGEIVLETGLNSRFSTTYRAGYSLRDYSDTNDPDFYDREEYRLSMGNSFKFTDVTTGTLNLSGRHYEYSDGRELHGDNLSARFGLAHEFSETFNIEADAGYSRSRENDLDERTISIEEGPTASIRANRLVPDGSYFAMYDRRMVQETFRNRLSFGRKIERDTYTLSGSVGLSALDDGDTVPTFELSYGRELRDGRFTASLQRSVTLNTDDEGRILTSAGAGYTHEINQLSSFRLGLDYSFVENTGDSDEDDETRATVTATYTRSLTPDWKMSVGYRGRVRTYESDDDAYSNAVFVSVGRRFVFRP